MIKIRHSKSFWTTLVGKDWKMCEMTKIEHSKSFLTTLMGKDWKKCEMTKIEHSKLFWTTLVGKGAEQPKVSIPNDFIPLWREKFRKSVK